MVTETNAFVWGSEMQFSERPVWYSMKPQWYWALTARLTFRRDCNDNNNNDCLSEIAVPDFIMKQSTNHHEL